MGKTAIDIVSTGQIKREADFFERIPEDVKDKVFYYCVNHDYVYVPEHFTDLENVRRKSGYYDETGKYYSNLRIIDEDRDGCITCKYCGNTTDLREKPEILQTLKCPHCDAGLEYLKEEAKENINKKVDLTEIERPPKKDAIYKDNFKYKKSFEQYEKEYKKNKVAEFFAHPAVKMLLLILSGMVGIVLLIYFIPIFSWLIIFFEKIF